MTRRDTLLHVRGTARCGQRLNRYRILEGHGQVQQRLPAPTIGTGLASAVAVRGGGAEVKRHNAWAAGVHRPARGYG